MSTKLISPYLLFGVLLLLTPLLIFPTLQPIVGGSVFFVYICLAIYFGPARKITQALLFLPITILSLTVVMGAAVSADPQLTIPKLFNFFLGILWWHFLAVQTPGLISAKLMTFFVMALGVMMVLWGVLSADWPNKVGFINNITNLLPSIGQSIQTNQIAGTILLVLFLPLSYIKSKSVPMVMRIACGFVFLLLIAILVLTQSRSGLIGAIAGMLVLAAIPLRHKFSPRINVMLLGSFASLLVLGIAVAITLREPTPDSQMPSSFDRRLEIWRWGYAAASDFPLTGTGLGSFRVVFSRLYPSNISAENDIAHAHNIFLQIALDVGIIGLIAYIALIMIAFVACWNHIENVTVQAILATIVAFHAYGLTDTLALGSKTHLIFWMVIGLLKIDRSNRAKGA